MTVSCPSCSVRQRAGCWIRALALIGGSGATSVFATVDIGQTVFAYTVYLSALKITDGQKTGARDVVASPNQ